jgi:hypothetical protein
MTGLQELFSADGDGAGMAQVKAAAHLSTLMQQEANVAAYQDVFLCSAFISLFTILPGLLRSAAPRTRTETAVPKKAPVGSESPILKATQD